MKTQTSAVARQQRLRSWAQMVRDCQTRPIGMSVDEWCETHSITKANYYYRMTQVRKACLDAMPSEIAKQAVVPVPAELMSLQTADTVNAACAQESSFELSVNAIFIDGIINSFDFQLVFQWNICFFKGSFL